MIAAECPVIRRGVDAVAESWAWGEDVTARAAALRAVLAALDGTRSTPEVEAARAMLARRFAVRVAAPFWLRRAKNPALTAHADALAALVLTPEALPAVVLRVREAHAAAHSASCVRHTTDVATAGSAAYAAAHSATTEDCGSAADAAACAAEGSYGIGVLHMVAAGVAAAGHGSYNVPTAQAMLTLFCRALLAMCAVTPITAPDVLATDTTEVSQ